MRQDQRQEPGRETKTQGNTRCDTGWGGQRRNTRCDPGDGAGTQWPESRPHRPRLPGKRFLTLWYVPSQARKSPQSQGPHRIHPSPSPVLEGVVHDGLEHQTVYSLGWARKWNISMAFRVGWARQSRLEEAGGQGDRTKHPPVLLPAPMPQSLPRPHAPPSGPPTPHPNPVTALPRGRELKSHLTA